MPVLVRFIIICLMASPLSAKARSGFSFTYGQSADVWRLVSDIKGAKKDLVRINAILNENFGSYQTAFVRMGSDFGIAKLASVAWPAEWRGWAGIEGAALGLVQNPVVPELQASILAMGLLETSLLGRFSEGLFLEAGLAFGAGIERRLSAVSTDLIEKMPFQKEKILLFGLDLALRKHWRFERSQLRIMARTKETFFRGIGGQTSVALDRDLRELYHQWQLRGDFGFENYGLHTIVGPHPLPSDLLPRIWNRAANTHHWRELGAMSGAGASAQWRLGKASSLSAIAGFYGGYIGGELRWRFGERSRLGLLSYGIENSSAYHALGQRVYALQAYFAF
jgi:hypothetical protein